MDMKEYNKEYYNKNKEKEKISHHINYDSPDNFIIVSKKQHSLYHRKYKDDGEN
jgi:hypothetical protein